MFTQSNYQLNYSFNPITEKFIHSFENTFNPPSISFILPGASAANVEKSNEEDKARHFARHYKHTGTVCCPVSGHLSLTLQ